MEITAPRSARHESILSGLDCTVLHKNSRPGLGVFLYGWELRRLQHPAARVGFVFDWRSATKKGVVLELLGAFTRMQSQLDLLGPSKMTSNCFKFFQQLGTSQLLKLHSRLGGRSEGGDTLDRYELLIAVLQHLAEGGAVDIPPEEERYLADLDEADSDEAVKGSQGGGDALADLTGVAGADRDLQSSCRSAAISSGVDQAGSLSSGLDNSSQHVMYGAHEGKEPQTCFEGALYQHADSNAYLSSASHPEHGLDQHCIKKFHSAETSSHMGGHEDAGDAIASAKDLEVAKAAQDVWQTAMAEESAHAAASQPTTLAPSRFDAVGLQQKSAFGAAPDTSLNAGRNIWRRLNSHAGDSVSRITQSLEATEGTARKERSFTEGLCSRLPGQPTHLLIMLQSMSAKQMQLYSGNLLHSMVVHSQGKYRADLKKQARDTLHYINQLAEVYNLATESVQGFAIDKDLKRVLLRQAEHLELLLMFEDARSRMADVATQPQWNVVMHDLHGMDEDFAKSWVKFILRHYGIVSRLTPTYIMLIVGIGNHSLNNEAELPPAIMKLLRSFGLTVMLIEHKSVHRGYGPGLQQHGTDSEGLGQGPSLYGSSEEYQDQARDAQEELGRASDDQSACDLNMMVRNLELCARVSWEDSQRKFAAGYYFEVFNAVMYDMR
ncbi:hypothetical protein WJX82_004686 [Trebouxia sp. C0006]